MRNLKCPKCGGKDNIRVRGSEVRILKDIPYLGREIIWELTMPELQCCGCGRESFLPDLSELVRSGTGRLIRLEEFIVFLAARTSSEGAAKILQSMNTDISGDTVQRIVAGYEKNQDSDIWIKAHQFEGKPIHGITEDSAEDFGNSLAYYMGAEIICPDREKRIEEMVRLFNLVFTEKKRSPGWNGAAAKKKSRLPAFTWKNE